MAVETVCFLCIFCIWREFAAIITVEDASRIVKGEWEGGVPREVKVRPEASL